ncbi:hypothetical protein [uncultured Kordia sp.]|uniref:hypothetical protein n=1 Tax=uncultured Kordia sp. TaxID=507699 RepID=UPI002614B208|nr:hypothetical protein [uncultured Kordia sp.]
MKNFMISRFWILLVFISGSIFAQDKDCIYGDWAIETINEGSQEGSMIFKKDNTVTVALGNSEPQTEKFTIEGNDIVVVINGNENKATIKSCDDSMLTLFDQKGKATIVLKRVTASKRE